MQFRVCVRFQKKRSVPAPEGPIQTRNFRVQAQGIDTVAILIACFNPVFLRDERGQRFSPPPSETARARWGEGGYLRCGCG